MGETALSQASREHRSHGTNQAGGPVGRDEHGVLETPGLEIAQELPGRGGILLCAGAQLQQDFCTGGGDPPGAEHRLAWLAQMQPFMDSVEEEIQHVGGREITGGEAW